MKVLVIGGTRFVGLRLVRLLAQEGHDITLLNRGKTKVLLPDGVRRLYADRRDSTAVESVLTNNSFEVVFDMTGYQVSNLESLVSILNGKIGHYVFQSTCGVYAESEVFPILEDFPYLTPTAFSSSYELNKVECEKFLFFGIQKAKEHFGFWPKYDLKSGLKNTYRWWIRERGQGRIRFIPGEIGHDVDLAYEDELFKLYT